jgi:hypothetical protein
MIDPIIHQKRACITAMSVLSAIRKFASQGQRPNLETSGSLVIPPERQFGGTKRVYASQIGLFICSHSEPRKEPLRREECVALFDRIPHIFWIRIKAIDLVVQLSGKQMTNSGILD